MSHRYNECDICGLQNGSHSPPCPLAPKVVTPQSRVCDPERILERVTAFLGTATLLFEEASRIYDTAHDSNDVVLQRCRERFAEFEAHVHRSNEL